MSRLLTLLLALSAFPAAAQSGWEVVDLGTEEDLRALTTETTNFHLVVGTNGFAARLPLGFDEWFVLDVGTEEDLLSAIRFSGFDGRYVSGRNGTVYYSTNSGTSWQEHALPDAEQDYVLAVPGSTVFAFGDGGAVYTTSSVGGTWSERDSGTASALRDAERYEDSLLGSIVVGEDGTILSTSFFGVEWEPLDSGTTADLYAIARIEETWLVVGEGGLVLKSTDDGQTWTPRESGTTATLYALANFGPEETDYLVAGENGTVLETRDFGETWCAHDTGTTTTLYAVAEYGAWYVAGEGGVMLKTLPSVCGAVANEPATPTPGYTLSAAWPNPMTDRTALALSVERAQHVTAEVVDVLGRRVALLFDGPAAAGAAQTLTFERGGLAGGHYLVRVRGETFADVRAVTLLP
jgi:photosystem II stability/assembly factor-like uncharacterized protein